MTAETFYGLKAGTLQLPGELGLWLFQWSGNEVKEERLGRKRKW